MPLTDPSSRSMTGAPDRGTYINKPRGSQRGKRDESMRPMRVDRARARKPQTRGY